MSIKTYNLIKSIGCKTINAWSININNKSYIITPAHNLIYQSSITESTAKSINKSWIKSNFTDSSDIKYFQKEYDNKWYVMKKYIETKSPPMFFFINLSAHEYAERFIRIQLTII